MKYFATALLIFAFAPGFSQNGHEIRVTLKPFRNQYIYLGHYYGKQLPIIDSVKLDANSQAVFKGPNKLGGGIYLIGFPDRARNFEVLIDKNQKFSVSADTTNLAVLRFENSPENNGFRAYQAFMGKNGKSLDSLYKLRTGSAKEDSLALTKKIDALNTTIKEYRAGIISKDPNSLLAVLLKAMREPEVPTNDPAAKTDSLFAYRYFKKHYWDGVSFFDDRLARTPFFESRIDKYFEQLVYPSADSVIRELDYMLGYSGGNAEMQKFLLLKFVNRYLNQKYMWEDRVYVHLYEKYISQKTYPWLSDKGMKILTDRYYNLVLNTMGSPASDVDLPDTAGKKINLYSLKSPYTLVAIWDPKCSHCKEVVPKLDSAYHAKWRSLGLSLFGLAKETDGTKSDWLGFIREHKLSDWTHVYYSREDDQARVSAGIPSYSQLYDVQSFPTLYLLDKDKRIVAKKVTIEQIDGILANGVKNQ